MPQLFWNAGCQLVALNYQTIGKALVVHLSYQVGQLLLTVIPGESSNLTHLKLLFKDAKEAKTGSYQDFSSSHRIHLSLRAKVKFLGIEAIKIYENCHFSHHFKARC